MKRVQYKVIAISHLGCAIERNPDDIFDTRQWLALAVIREIANLGPLRLSRDVAQAHRHDVFLAITLVPFRTSGLCRRS